MKFKHYPKDKLDNKLKEIVGKHVDLDSYKLFYFGSRVEGKGDDRSDIDVGIDGPKKIPYEKLEAIREEVKWLPTLYSIDIVDFNNTSENFKEVALKNIEEIT